METIVCALISAASAIVVGVISSHSQHKRLITELERHDEMHAYRINQLEAKVDVHNHLVERMYRLEEAQSLTDEKIKVANHRLDDLERR